MTEDFDWGVEQIGEKTLNLKGKGYNGKVIKVELGEGAKMLYTDAQVSLSPSSLLCAHTNVCFTELRTFLLSSFVCTLTFLEDL